MIVRLEFKITDKNNPGIINFLALLIDKKTNLVPAWALYGLSGKVIVWENPIKKGIGNYRGARINLNEISGEPYGTLVYEKDILSLTNGYSGKLIDAAGNFRNAEFRGCRIAEQDASIQMPRFLA